MAEVQRFTVTLVGDHRRRVLVPVLYRRAYLRYIDATKRPPKEWAARIAEVVALLAAGVKQR